MYRSNENCMHRPLWTIYHHKHSSELWVTFIFAVEGRESNKYQQTHHKECPVDNGDKNHSTQDSRVVPHRGTNWAALRLTAQIGRDAVLSKSYGRG